MISESLQFAISLCTIAALRELYHRVSTSPRHLLRQVYLKFIFVFNRFRNLFSNILQICIFFKCGFVDKSKRNCAIKRSGKKFSQFSSQPTPLSKKFFSPVAQTQPIVVGVFQNKIHTEDNTFYTLVVSQLYQLVYNLFIIDKKALEFL